MAQVAVSVASAHRGNAARPGEESADRSQVSDQVGGVRVGVEVESSGTFAGGSLERKSWEGSGSAGLILTVHSAPHRRRVMVSGDHVIRIRDAKCLLGFG